MVEVDYVEAPMSNKDGVFAKIDPENYGMVTAFGKWYVNDSGYALKKTRIKGKNVSLRMHMVINNTPKGFLTDHINGDRLDNRKLNLRSVGAAMNAWNRHVDRVHTKYLDLPKGISYDINRNQYVATRVQRKRFKTLEEAKNFVAESENEL